MSYNKYRVRQYNPTNGAPGSHSVFVEEVIDNEINNNQLAEMISAMTGFKKYECKCIIGAIAEVVERHMLQNQRVVISDDDGNRFITIQPKVTGSVSDTQIEAETTAAHAVDPTVEIRHVALESDMTKDRMTWSLDAKVGLNYIRDFAKNKVPKKVKTVNGAVVVVDDNGNPVSDEGSDTGTTVDTSTGSNTGGNDIPAGNG